MDENKEESEMDPVFVWNDEKSGKNIVRVEERKEEEEEEENS